MGDKPQFATIEANTGFIPPGKASEATSERERAVELARSVVKSADVNDPLHLLARQLLRALGLSAAG